jgi:hypothetical protein
MSTSDLLDELESLARYYTVSEERYVIATAVGAKPGSVVEAEGRVRRGGRTEIVEFYVINDKSAQLTPENAVDALSALAKLRPEALYLRLFHPASGSVAFADLEIGDCLWAPKGGEPIDLCTFKRRPKPMGGCPRVSQETGSLSRSTFAHLIQQGGLADPRRALDNHHAARSGYGSPNSVLDEVELCVAFHEVGACRQHDLASTALRFC